MAEIVTMIWDGSNLTAKNQWNSEVWKDHNVLNSGRFADEVRGVVNGQAVYIQGLEDRVKGMREHMDRMCNLMETMAKRLDEIDATNEWSRLERMARDGKAE